MNVLRALLPLANAYDVEYRALLQKWRRRGVPSDGGRVRLVSGAEFRDCGGNSHDANYWWGCCWYVWCLRLFQLAIANLKVVAVSAITNMAEGLSDVEAFSCQTLAAAELSKQNFIKSYFAAFCAKLHQSKTIINSLTSSEEPYDATRKRL